MTEAGTGGQSLPDNIAAIKKRGYVVFATAGLSPDFMARFDPERVPVVGIRQVRIWGLQVDDEREIPGHERISIPDEETWEINLEAKDGSHYEVNCDLVAPAPE